MITKFDQVKSIHERAVETQDASVLREIPAMLNSWGIKCREKDGQLLWTNLSVRAVKGSRGKGVGAVKGSRRGKGVGSLFSALGSWGNRFKLD